MKRIENITTATFELEDNFLLDIVTDYDRKLYEAYIYNKGYGIKEHVFGVPFHQTYTGEDETFEGFCDLVECQIDDYIEFYRNDYMECGGVDHAEIVSHVAEFFNVDRDDDDEDLTDEERERLVETGGYDTDSYDWEAGCYHNDIWLCLNKVVECLESYEENK